MATIYKWTPFEVALDITATGSTVTRTSATKYTVKINASWETYYSGAKTNYGMTASSGGGSVTLNSFGTKASSGSGSFTGTYTISGNGAATKTITVTFRNFNNDNGKSATKNVSFSVSVPAWTSYIVKYNANGGSGAPGNQTKWKDQTLKLSTTKPTRTGYSFLGWSTSSSATSATYSAGGNYTSNSAATLYAVWKANTYVVKYNANGGSGAPGNQTKTYGKTLTLSSTKPTRTNYNFKGWGTSASATTVSYAAGGSYTANAAITLYAVWQLAYTKPRITNVTSTRCNSSGTAVDEGQNGLISFKWACDKAVSSISIKWKVSTGSTWSSTTVSASGTSGTVSKVIGSNVADIAYQTKFSGGILQPILAVGTDMNTIQTPNVYSGRNITDNAYTNVPFTKGSFTLRVEAAGPNGQIKQTVTTCDKNIARVWERFYYTSAWGEWKCVYDMAGTLLWSGAYYMNENQTASLSEKVSKQPSGISLVFSEYYDGEAKNQTFISFFVSKKLVTTQSGRGHSFILSTSNFGYMGTKYLYISDDKIVGHANNASTGTAGTGVKYTSNRFVLRYVIGV